jgi:D-aminopeptidase
MSHASVVVLALLPLVHLAAAPEGARPRARDAGVVIGILPPGPLDAITDVAGVRVGHVTLVEGDDVRTGVTVVLPHGGNVFRDKVPAAIFVGNGFGKLTGVTQIEELGALETPIALTGTLNAFRVADALIDWVLALPGNEDVLSVNPVVGECNDGTLSDIRRRPVGREHARRPRHGVAGTGCRGGR